MIETGKLGHDAIDYLGWMLVNSAWQIAFVSVWLWAALRLIPKSKPGLRYLVSMSSVCAVPVLTLTTIFVIAFGEVLFAPAVSDLERQLVAFGSSITQTSGFLLDSGLTSIRRESGIADLFGLFGSDRKDMLAGLFPILVAAWLVGLLIMLIRLGGGILTVRKIAGARYSEADEWIQKAFANAKCAVNLSRVRIAISEIAAVPMVAGLLRPVVVVPAGIGRIAQGKLESILTHELVHLRRYDHIANSIQVAIETVFFFHPGIWWISKQVRHERECACDAEVLELSAGTRYAYANALAEFEMLRQESKKQELLLAANGGNLMDRINRIIGEEGKISRSQTSLWTAGLASMLIMVVLTTVFWAKVTTPVNNVAEQADRVVKTTEGSKRAVLNEVVETTQPDRSEKPTGRRVFREIAPLPQATPPAPPAKPKTRAPKVKPAPPMPKAEPAPAVKPLPPGKLTKTKPAPLPPGKLRLVRPTAPTPRIAPSPKPAKAPPKRRPVRKVKATKPPKTPKEVAY